MAPQFQHKCLAETHNFSIALSTWREVRTTFTSAHRQGSQRVFERLFESEEFKDGKIDRSMETNTTFVRTNRIVELYAIAEICLNFSFIVYPSDTESKNTVWFYQSFDDFSFFKFRMLIVDVFDRKKYFLHCLKIFRLTGMFCLQRGHDFLDVHNSMFLKRLF